MSFYKHYRWQYRSGLLYPQMVEILEAKTKEIDTEKIKSALADPDAPWYSSDLVSWVADLLEDYEAQAQLKAEAVAARVEAENECCVLRGQIEQLEEEKKETINELSHIEGILDCGSPKKAREKVIDLFEALQKEAKE